jgi:hypothetical protein
METTLGIIRHILTFGGGFLVAKGYITAGDLPQIVGAGVTIAGAIWSILAKSDKFPKIK